VKEVASLSADDDPRRRYYAMSAAGRGVLAPEIQRLEGRPSAESSAATSSKYCRINPVNVVSRKRRECEALEHSFQTFRFKIGKRNWTRADLHARS
jgi:hypothetical protein